MTQSELLAEQIKFTRDWTKKLIVDVSDDDWFYQPEVGLAHPLWLCGHLACAQDLLIHKRVLQKPLLDETFHSHFPIGGPVKSMKQHDYPPVPQVLEMMDDIHRKTLDTVRGMDDELLSQPCFGADGKTPHPHYRDKRGAVSHCSHHEAFHAGQLALIRRLLGKPFLR